MKTRFFIVMGVSGCGKSSVGQSLAQFLGWDFYDADNFHPPENVAKMANGTPLDDPGVLACSALKERYRKQLTNGNRGVQIVYLKGSYDLIWSRMEKRTDHYMKPHMLKSQFETLEEPSNALTIDISISLDDIVQEILEHMEK